MYVCVCVIRGPQRCRHLAKSINNPYIHCLPVFAIDIKNEPHGGATWGAGKAATDWNKAAEKIGKHLLGKHPEFKVCCVVYVCVRWWRV